MRDTLTGTSSTTGCHPIWEQQAGESNPAWEAFRLYLFQVSGRRSLRRTALQLGKARALIERWSVRWRWPQRVHAWDVAQGSVGALPHARSWQAGSCTLKALAGDVDFDFRASWRSDFWREDQRLPSPRRAARRASGLPSVPCRPRPRHPYGRRPTSRSWVEEQRYWWPARLLDKREPVAMPHGGVRYLVACPLCARRATRLYLSELVGGLCCRACAGLRYASQTLGRRLESDPARILFVVKTSRQAHTTARRIARAERALAHWEMRQAHWRARAEQATLEHLQQAERRLLPLLLVVLDGLLEVLTLVDARSGLQAHGAADELAHVRATMEQARTQLRACQKSWSRRAAA